MLSKEELQEIESRTWDIIAVDADKRHLEKIVRHIPALLDHIEHQRRALEWLRKREVSIYELAAPCQCEDDFLDANGNCPHGENPENICPKYHFRGTGECWIDYALNATNEATND